ncbi:hypothetical protein B7463_g5991, partial [Scytalidium lignicola]
MNDQSPPKRVTRSRAAAKSTDTGMKTTKVATAAAKAKLIRSTSTTKRKTRTHDADQEEETHHELVEEPLKPQPRATRGRPKKVIVVQPEPEPEPEPERVEEVVAPARATRGRVKSVAVETAPPPKPARTTRGRAKKAEDVEPPQEPPIVVEETREPPARSTRNRAAPVTKTVAPKKSVKFQDQDKENLQLVAKDTKGKEKAVETATGLRAKPVRRPVASTARATRGRAKQTEEKTEKSPLSPKKTQTQVAVSHEAASDDELATMEKTPMKPLTKTPVKPPGSIFGAAKRLDFATSISVQNAVTSPTQELKGSIMASPARRPPQSPFKESMKTSPQRLTFGDSLLRSPFKHTLLPPQAPAVSNLPLKASLMQSPARRLPSPTKVSEAGSPTRVTADASLFNATPKATTFAISRFTTPKTLPRPAGRAGLLASSTALRTSLLFQAEAENELEDSASQAPPPLQFSGRLSSIVSRDLDPALPPINSSPIPEEADGPVEEEALEDNAVEAEMEECIEVDTRDRTTTLPYSPPQHNTEDIDRRELDENPFQESDSEDELSAVTPEHASVPLSAFRISTIDLFPSPSAIPFTSMSETVRAATPRGSRVTSPAISFSSPRVSNIFGLSEKPAGEWVPTSPTKSLGAESDPAPNSPSSAVVESNSEDDTVQRQPTPIKNSFFEEEMSIRRDELAETEQSPAQTPELPLQVPALEPGFSDVEVDEEDLALAAEADEMSLIEPDEIADAAEEDTMVVETEPAPSEASQEYGDENAMPLDPALFAQPPPVAVAPPQTPIRYTPKRILTERISHTVSKIPLKPAAEDTPRRPMALGRSATVSRLPVQRSSGMLKRNNTVISYSPTKKTLVAEAQPAAEDVAMRDFGTPSRSDAQAWSTIATPARTPRPDLNMSLLKGAVVFVDVHTTEGADASGLFTELLTQMGARCVKTWNWNGNSEDGSKIGITHIVFKDGGKRTLEKARETGGVVACVGVGWVLDCERENKWLDEAPYAVDISLVPRGGHRRRKSMEPRVLANLNGQLIPASTPSRKSLSPETPNTSKVRRRDSVQWVRSPASSMEYDAAVDDQTLALSPVPVTPAPEAISAYAEEYLDGYDTPAAETPYFLHGEKLSQKTCPPPKRYGDLESPSRRTSGFLSEKKDETIMARLMAARRKSLQWAPKVGSPLAKGG